MTPQSDEEKARIICKNWLYGNAWSEGLVNEIAEALREEREAADERAASLCELKTDALLLLAGEMTGQELRLVKAVLKSRAAAIRSRA